MISFCTDRLKTALSRIQQNCDQWIKPPSSSPSSFTHADITPMSPPITNFGNTPGTSFGLKVCINICLSDGPFGDLLDAENTF